MSKSGKTLTIFLVLISILLLALSVIAVFYFHKESELRKLAEMNLEQSRATEAKLQAELKEAKKQQFLVEEKLKEADEAMNDLRAEKELADGVRDQIKEENATLKEALESETQAKEKIRQEVGEQLEAAKKRVAELESQVASEKKLRDEIESKLRSLEEQARQPGASAPSTVPVDSAPAGASGGELPSSELFSAPSTQSVPQSSRVDYNRRETLASSSPAIQLEKIFVGNAVASDIEGRILSVDKENDFIIFDLGKKDGVDAGTVMSIYRDQNYLGDVKVSKVQSDMAAADFIPPFSSQKVRKNDIISIKK